MSTSSHVRAALAKRYPFPEYAVFHEVPDAAGFNGKGFCDALAMGLWPSRGLHLHGFEIKVDRRDWIRELAAPEKAERFAKFCDFWSVIATDNVVKPDEVPAGWGYMNVSPGGRITVVKEPPANACRELTRGIFAAMCKAARRDADAEIVQRAREMADHFDRDRRAQFDERVKARIGDSDKWMRRFERLQKLMDGLEDESKLPMWLSDDEFVAAFVIAAKLKVSGTGYAALDVMERHARDLTAAVRKVKTELGLLKGRQ